MPEPRSMRHFAPLGCGLGAAVALGAFVYLVVKGDQAGTAASAATLCLALAILGALDLESFEGLGIKAKLRSTLSDAEGRLKAIDKMILSLARPSFSQAANGTVEFEEAQAMVNSLTASLQDMGLDKGEIDDLKKSFYSGLAWYHWNKIGDCYSSYMQKSADKVAAVIHAPGNEATIQTNYELLAKLRSERWPRYNTEWSAREFEDYSIKACDTVLVREENDREAFRTIVRAVNNIMKCCISSGNYTNEAISLIKYDNVSDNSDLNAAIKKISS